METFFVDDDLKLSSHTNVNMHFNDENVAAFNILYKV